MKKLEQIKITTSSLFMLVAGVLTCIVLAPLAEAVSPSPDGGYPGGNTAEGQNALLSLTSGTYNTAVGFLSLLTNATGSFNTATGAGALLANTATNNTATGAATLLNNGTGDANTADGAFALFSNTTGTRNTATGYNALENNTIGMLNTATGAFALPGNDGGNNNTATGGFALWDNTIGNGNTAVGASALFNNSTGSNNIALGAAAGTGVSTASNVICIGISGANVSGSFYVANVFETSIDPDNLPVFIDFTGRLGTQSSSRRFKEDITPMEKDSEAALALRPVTFHYKDDGKCRLRFGLIAEEVAEVNPELVVLDKEGKPYSVRYDQINAMLLNEFLKEHRRVEEQETTITQLRKEMETVVARLKEQDSKIQRVSDQVQMNKVVVSGATSAPP
jgi:hypothetical protein